MSRPQPENAVRRGAKTLLEFKGYFCSIVTNRAIMNKKGQMYFQGSPGLPDLLAIRGGCVVAVECKTFSGMLSESQKAWRQEWERHGGHYVVYRGPNDLRDY